MIQQLIAGILRHVLTVLGGSMVTQGYLDGEQLTSGIGAILTLVGIGWSIWQKYKARTKPGAAFNASAEVRPAIPNEPEAKFKLSPAAKRATNPNNKGFIEIGILFRLLVIVAVVTVFFLLGKLATAEPPGLSTINSQPLTGTCGGRMYSEWISYAPIEDQRPFLVRLLVSLRPWAESADSPRWSYQAPGGWEININDLAAGFGGRVDF